MMTSRIMVVPAHPRSRGEHLKDFFMAHGLYGSSPLARGTPRHIKCPGEHHRLIPARAGNTRSRARTSSSCSAHPRSRGEHCAWRVTVSPICGSSPLARGTPEHLSYRLGGRRLIPARAGNTRETQNGTPYLTAHPRSRGEHSREYSVIGCLLGSSPLARGPLTPRARGVAIIRLIPARAGNTLSMFLEWRLFTAHPRSRGEHFHDASATRAGAGSSPLARGTLRKVSYALGPSRLIPARAGNTQVEGFADFSASAHPRSRGEHGYEGFALAHCFGSSPLARGTQ